MFLDPYTKRLKILSRERCFVDLQSFCLTTKHWLPQDRRLQVFSQLHPIVATGAVSLENITGLDTHKTIFQILYLRSDEARDVEVHEDEKLDLSEIYRHLVEGDSVFIVRKNGANTEKKRISEKESARIFLQTARNRRQRPWYFNHV